MVKRGKTIGVLALQGDFALHQESLKRIGVKTKAVRHPEELDVCDGLIFPGGESTTFVRLLRNNNLVDPIRLFVGQRSIMGTCAGCIILSAKIMNDPMETLGLIDIGVERNSYGRQVDSFVDVVNVPFLETNPEYEGVFIRAPRIRSLGDGCEALGYHKEEIVMARNKRVLVTTFHPELTEDDRIHRFFIEEMT